jgi:hypothetical protein
VERTRSEKDGLTSVAYRGDGAALLAFDVSEELAKDLAGFALEFTPPGGERTPIRNRLSFDAEITAATTPAERTWTPSDEAPLQKFHWIHRPPDVKAGEFTYHVTAKLFESDGSLKSGPSADLTLELLDEGYANFDVGFTRAYISSQAYEALFNNADIEPDHPTIDFDTAPYQKQWAWLGFHARKLAFDFLGEAVADKDISLDVFAYDLNDPDFIVGLKELGPRLRLFLDNASLHAAPTDLEVAAHKLLADSAGADHIKVGHFSRFAHDKVLIQRRGGKAIRVLSGSANFSVRGFYVQANNVFVFDDEQLAGWYAEAFNQAFDDPSGFSAAEIASKWFEATGSDIPKTAVSFSPHKDAAISLDRVADAIAGAKSSVLFSVMELGGGGRVMEELHKLPGRDLYAFGTTQSKDGDISVTSPGHPAMAVPFAYLHDKVPAPFKAEISGGAGQVIHNKFVVVDFNGDSPVVFAGSSNLAQGGEEENGDNLVCFADSKLASSYAVEAIRLIDHYRFRAVQQDASSEEPLTLKKTAAEWVPDYFDPKSPKFRERTLFVAEATAKA